MDVDGIGISRLIKGIRWRMNGWRDRNHVLSSALALFLFEFCCKGLNMTPPRVKVWRFASDGDDVDVGEGKRRSVNFSKLLRGNSLSGNGEINSVMRRRAMARIWFFGIEAVASASASAEEGLGN